MKKLLFFTAMLTAAVTLQAGIPVPHYDFTADSDYSRYDDAVLECCNWLINTHADSYDAYRWAEVGEFIFMWVLGSPDVVILLDDFFMPYLDRNPEIMFWHMAGAARYLLERGLYGDAPHDTVKSTEAGIMAVIGLYEQETGILPKDKEVDKLVRLHRRGKLGKYIDKRVRKLGKLEPADLTY